MQQHPHDTYGAHMHSFVAWRAHLLLTRRPTECSADELIAVLQFRGWEATHRTPEFLRALLRSTDST